MSIRPRRYGWRQDGSDLPRPLDWLRPAVRAVPPYVPGEQPAAGRRVIKLNTNENPYPPSPRVIEALQAAVGASVRLYPDPEARALRATAAALYEVPIDCLMAGNGSDELLAILLRATIDPGDRVAYPVPTYSLYETLVQMQGGVVVAVPWTADWRIPSALASTGARVTFLCNPNAPSGTFVPVAEIEALARDLAGVLLVDEAYVDFAADHAMRLVQRSPNVCVLRTLSKSYSLAGLRVGLLAGHPELIEGLRAVKDSYNLNLLSQVAARAALEDQATMRANADRIRATRHRVTDALSAIGYEVLPSETNFVLARRTGVDQKPIQERLAVRDVFVRHFSTPELRDALRITVGTDDDMTTFLTALRAVLSER